MSKGTGLFRARRALASVVALSLIAGVLGLTNANTQTAQAADLSKFNPGLIISDAVFYDYGSMSAAQIQSFIEGKQQACKSSGSSTCLKDFKQTTKDITDDKKLCTGKYVGAKNEKASTIIYKVSQACKVNPKVLLVLLQKEQGLITKAGGESTYRISMGYGCPDTAACDSQFYGFSNQVYRAARQYQNYRVNAKSFKYQAGKTIAVQYHPDTKCKTQNVAIKNQATAGLYNYTPYVPNAAALKAGYGTGDKCSSYGNRNFFNYFTDWFGSTTGPVVKSGAIRTKWNAMKGESGVLGIARDNGKNLANGGQMQTFKGGVIYYSPKTGAHVVRWGSTYEAWKAQKWEQGSLGYPVNDGVTLKKDGGTAQTFQGGSIMWSKKSGTHKVLNGTLRDKYRSMNWENGVLGFPVADQAKIKDGGYAQTFQGGSIMWSKKSGSHAVLNGAVRDKYRSLKWENGVLGFPTNSGYSIKNNGRTQSFQGGMIYSQQSAGTHMIPSGPIRDKYRALKYEQGYLGYPTSEVVTAKDGSKKQTFQGGTITWTKAKGAVAKKK